MALIKTDYGLVYNDDGSLCVTVREDDIPFPGVKSFAVEEGTTNLSSADLTTWGTQYANISSTGENLYGMNIYKLTEDTTASSVHQLLSPYITTAGITYTASIYAKAGERKILELAGAGINADGWQPKFDVSNGTYVGDIPVNGSYSITPVGSKWYRITLTHTDTAGGHNVIDYFLNDDAGNRTYDGDGVSGIYLSGSLVEQKSFATSFVDGTRIAGNLVYNPLIPTDNFIINFWFNSSKSLQAYYDQGAQNQYGTIIQANNYASVPSFSYWIYSNVASQNPVLKVFISYNSGWEQVVTVFDQASVSPIFDGFNMHTLIFDNLTCKVYVNGEYIAEGTYTTPMDVSYLTMKYADGLLSDFYIGKYKDTNGNIIWTDDYIKYVYEQKKPFYVAKKLYL